MKTVHSVGEICVYVCGTTADLRIPGNSMKEVLYIHEQSFQKASQVDLQLDLLYNNGEHTIICDFQNFTMEQNNYLLNIL